MAFFSGLDGKLLLGNNPIAKVQNWSLNATQAVLETTSLQDTDRTLINGVRSMSGSCRVFYYTEANGSSDAKDFFGNIIKTGNGSIAPGSPAAESSSVEFKLYADDNNNYIHVYAWITGASMSMAVGEVMSVDVTFEVSGHANRILD